MWRIARRQEEPSALKLAVLRESLEETSIPVLWKKLSSLLSRLSACLFFLFPPSLIFHNPLQDLPRASSGQHSSKYYRLTRRRFLLQTKLRILRKIYDK